MLRRMIAVLPIVIVATLLVSEGSAQAILPVKKNVFYVGPLIAHTNGVAKSSAGSNFTVPSLSCSTGTAAATGIVFGSGIYSSVSNWVSAGGVDAECQGGVAVYTAQVIIDNQVTDMSVTPAAGDAISTSVSITKGQTQVIFDDITQNSSTTTTVPGGALLRTCYSAVTSTAIRACLESPISGRSSSPMRVSTARLPASPRV